MAKVLITGGSGSIGRMLIPRLKELGHEVAVIGRSRYNDLGVPSFTWDLSNQKMEEDALDGVTHIVHLAGAGIADKSWTSERKQEILESRVRPLQIMSDALIRRKQNIEAIISSSAVGYYGAISSDRIFSEDDASANDFIGITCQMWEDAVQLFRPITNREIRIRTGVVLMKDVGALSKMSTPVKYGMGSPLGSGEQWMPWIHVHDLVNIFIKAIESTVMEGPYNAASPEPVNQLEFVNTVGEVLDKPIFLPAVPEFVLKMTLGQMADIVTKGSRVSVNRIQSTGFEFKYPHLRSGFIDMLG